MDPVLVIFEDDGQLFADRNEVAAKMDRYRFFQRGPIVTITKSSSEGSSSGNQTASVTWEEEFEAELVVEATVAGKSMKVMSRVTSFVTNSLIGDNWQATSSSMNTTLTSSAYDRIEEMEYPLAVTTDYQDLNHSFLIVADIDIGLTHAMKPNVAVSADGTVDESQHMVYIDRIRANATYRRSSDPDRTIFVQLGSSRQDTSVLVGADSGGTICFEQHLEANQGFVTRFEEQRGGCNIPENFCSKFDICSPRIINTSQIVSSSPVSPRNLLYRHPRSAFKTIQEQHLLVDETLMTLLHKQG